MSSLLPYQPTLFEPVLDIKKGRELRDMGIERAEKSANKKYSDWSRKAYQVLEEFLEITNGEFMTEEVRAFAAMKDDFELPSNAKAWGGVIVRARVRGLIKEQGYRQVSNKLAHATPARVWIKV